MHTGSHPFGLLRSIALSPLDTRYSIHSETPSQERVHGADGASRPGGLFWR